MPTGVRPPTPHNIARLAVTGDVGGRPWANVFYVETDEPGISTSAGALDMANAFKGAITNSSLYQQFHSSLHVTQCQCVIQLTPDTAVQGITAMNLVGAAGGSVQPASAAVVVSWLSGAFWRGGKPRTYIPGVSSTFLDTNHSLIDGIKNGLITIAETLRTNVNGITTPAVDKSTMGFVSYASGKVWRATPLFLPYTGAIVHDRLGSQRRRLGPWLR